MTSRSSSTRALIAPVTLAPRAAQVEIGVRRRFRQRLAHRMNARGEPLIDALGVAVGGLHQIRKAQIDDPRALIGGFGESRKARVEDLRALPGCVDDNAPVRVERRAERGFVLVEQTGNPLGMIADLVLELRPARFESPAQILHRCDDLVLELIDTDAERSGDFFDPARQRSIHVAGHRRERLRQLVGSPLQGFADFG